LQIESASEDLTEAQWQDSDVDLTEENEELRPARAESRWRLNFFFYGKKGGRERKEK
jgi:hypothetical protein